jgi:hypothetical protein
VTGISVLKNAILLHHIAVGWSKTVQNIIEQNILTAHSFFVLVNQGCNPCYDQIKVSVEVHSTVNVYIQSASTNNSITESVFL